MMYLYDVIIDPEILDAEIRRIEQMWHVTFDHPVKNATTKIEVWATPFAESEADKVDVVLFDRAGKELARREIPGY